MMNNEYDTDIVANSVNFHGHQLLKLLIKTNKPAFENAKLKNVDYKSFTKRSSIIRRQGELPLELMKFMASKLDVLFKKEDNPDKISRINKNYEDSYTNQLPLEYFMNCDVNIKQEQFFKIVKRGDILNVMVSGVDANYTLKPISFDNGVHRYLADWRTTTAKIFMKTSDTKVEKVDGDFMQRWIVGTRLRAEVLEVNEHHMNLFVGTLGTTLPPNSSVILGKIKIADIPAIFTSKARHKFLFECFSSMETSKNPKIIEDLSTDYNLSLTDYPSLMSSLRNKIPAQEMASSLRSVQLVKWAHKHVAEGVNHFKNGDHTSAFQCIERALKIDNKNEEAYVAKGALLANLSHYEKAIDEFQKALDINANHQNAVKYMCETLIELGRQYQEESKFQDAEHCYARCLKLDKKHEAGRMHMRDLADVANDDNLLRYIEDSPPPNKTSADRDILDDIEEMDKEFKKIKGEKCSKMEDNNKSIEEIKLELEQPRKLSPLSEKMAMMQEQSYVLPPHPTPGNNHIHGSNETIAPIPSARFSVPPPGITNAPWPPGIMGPERIPVMDHNIPPYVGLNERNKIPPLMSTFDRSYEQNKRYNIPSSDTSYEDKVNAFLKQLESKPRGSVIPHSASSSARSYRSRSRSRGRSPPRPSRHLRSRSRSVDSRKKSKKKKRKQSSSSSYSSSSSSSGYSRKSKGKKDKKRKNKSKSKSKKKKKSEKKEKEIKRPDKEKDSSLSLPDLNELEEKLAAYFNKVNKVSPSRIESSSLTRSNEKSGKGRSKHDDSDSKYRSNSSHHGPSYYNNNPIYKDSRSYDKKNGASTSSSARFGKWDDSKIDMFASQNKQSTLSDYERKIAEARIRKLSHLKEEKIFMKPSF